MICDAVICRAMNASLLITGNVWAAPWLITPVVQHPPRLFVFADSYFLLQMVADLQHWFLLLFEVTAYSGITFIPRTDVTLWIWDSPRVPGDHHHWQNSHFWAIAFLRRFCQTWLFRHGLAHPVCTSLNFATVRVISLQSTVVSRASSPPTWRIRGRKNFCDVAARPSRRSRRCKATPSNLNGTRWNSTTQPVRARTVTSAGPGTGLIFIAERWEKAGEQWRVWPMVRNSRCKAMKLRQKNERSAKFLPDYTASRPTI
jgi:hypothetical protein